jgi:hypothetical protein
VFDGNDIACPAYVKQTLNVVFRECTFTNIANGLYFYQDQTHESIIDSCYFTNNNNYTAPYALSIGIDSHVTNNNFIGFQIAIDVGNEMNGGCNIITNNHMYQIRDWGIRTGVTAIQNVISNNYFDGCSLLIMRDFSTLSVTGNVFLLPGLSAGVFFQNIAARTNVSNNSYNFVDTKKTRFQGVQATISGNVMTFANPILLSTDVGLSNITNTLCITGYISPTQATVAYDSEYVTTGTLQTYYLYPCNVAVLTATTSHSFSQITSSNEVMQNGIDTNASPKTKTITLAANWGGTVKVTTKGNSPSVNLMVDAYTTSNLSGTGTVTIATLPNALKPSIPLSGTALVQDPNTNALLGTCKYTVNSTVNAATIQVTRAVGAFNQNNVEYVFNLTYFNYAE